MKKFLNDKYALLKLRRNIEYGPIFHTKKEVIYGLSINNIIKKGKTITFHDVVGRLVYKGSDYIYKRFSIYAFIQLRLLRVVDSKNDTSDWRSTIDYKDGEIIGLTYIEDGDEKGRLQYVKHLKSTFPDPDKLIKEEIAYSEKHRSYIKGVRDGYHNFLTVIILDGRYTKVNKKDGTIVIYDHGSFNKYICNTETGQTFVEAYLGEKYNNDDEYFKKVIDEDSTNIFQRAVNIMFDIELFFVHLFGIGDDNSKKYKFNPGSSDIVY
jgi:hypothetical protein